MTAETGAILVAGVKRAARAHRFGGVSRKPVARSCVRARGGLTQCL